MRKFLLVIVVWMSFALFAQPLAMAAEDTAGGFFGFKKFIKKNATDAASKKKPKSTSSDSELTDEEKKQVQEMAGKIPAKGPASGKANTKIPARVLSAPPAKVPEVVAQNAPVAPPKNPNAIVIRPPTPPGRVPQVPFTAGPAQPFTPKKK